MLLAIVQRARHPLIAPKTRGVQAMLQTKPALAGILALAFTRGAGPFISASEQGRQCER